MSTWIPDWMRVTLFQKFHVFYTEFPVESREHVKILIGTVVEKLFDYNHYWTEKLPAKIVLL